MSGCGYCKDGIKKADGEFCHCPTGVELVRQANETYFAQRAKEADPFPDISDLAEPSCTECADTGEVDGVPCSCGIQVAV